MGIAELIAAKKVGEGVVSFEGAVREFDVLDKNLGVPCPRYFVSYNNGRPFISNEVRPVYQQRMVFHELVEFEKYEDQEGRCVKALNDELRLVSSTKLLTYVRFRKEVFEGLLEFSLNNQPDFIDEIKGSIARLDQIIRSKTKG